MSKYDLTDLEIEKWRGRVARHLPHGGQARAVASLSSAIPRKETTLRRYLSDFARGKATGLEFFLEGIGGAETPVIALERHLQLEEGRFARYLAEVRSNPATDDTYDVRLPGFSDLGPIDVSDAWLLPVQRTVQSRAGRASQGGVLDMDLLVHDLRPARVADVGNSGRTVCLVTGPRGSGRSTLVLRLTQLLADGGSVTRSVAELADDDELVVIDDVGRLTRGENRAVAEWAADGSRRGILLVVGEPGEALGYLRDPDTVVELGVPTADWLEKWLTHLANLAEAHWGLSLDANWLIEWLHDEPTAIDTAGTPDIAGILLRRGPEDSGHQTRPTREFVLRRVLEHTAELLALMALDESATFMRMHGRALVSTLAVATFRAASRPPERTEFARLAWLAIKRNLDLQEAQGELRDSGGFSRLLTDLSTIGFFPRGSDNLEMSPHSLLPLALGDAIVAGALEADEILEELVMAPQWHPTLEFLGESPRTADHILEMLLELPEHLLTQAIPALSRVLCSRLAASRTELITQAFRLCLCWWARCGQTRPPMTLSLSLGGLDLNKAEPAPQGRIGSFNPLVLLGRASGELRDFLPPIDPTSIQAGEGLSDGLFLYLEATGQREITSDVAMLAALVGAPFQMPLEVVLSGDSLRRIAPGGHPDTTSPPIDGDEFDTWWRVVFLPLLEQVDDRRRAAILSGIPADVDIRWWMYGPWRRAEAWANALARMLREDDPAAVRALADALSSAAARGGRANMEACRGIWSSIAGSRAPADRPTTTASSLARSLGTGTRRRTREAIAERTLEALSALTVDQRSDTDFVEWLLSEVLGTDRRDRLWSAWLASDPSRVPWQAFYSAGLPAEEIGRWALETGDLDPTVQERVTQLARSGEPGLIDLSVDQRRPGAALTFFVEAKVEGPDLKDRLAVLRLAVLHGRPEVKTKAIKALRFQHGPDARPIRLELSALLDPPDCFGMAPPTKPQPGESDFWAGLAARAHEVFAIGSLSLLARSDLADVMDGKLDEADGLWPRTMAMLTLADLALMSPEERDETLASENPLPPEMDLSPIDLDSAGRATLEATLVQVLGQLVLEITGKHDPLPGATELAAGIAESPRLLGLIRPDGAQIRLLRMASDENGPAWMAEHLAEACQGLSEAQSRSLMLATLQGGGDPLILEVFSRTRLRRPMAQVMAARLHPRAVRLARAAVEMWGFEESTLPEELPVGHLFRRWLSFEPEAAVEALRTGVEDSLPEHRRAWWRFTVRHLAPGSLRAEAVRELISA